MDSHPVEQSSTLRNQKKARHNPRKARRESLCLQHESAAEKTTTGDRELLQKIAHISNTISAAAITLPGPQAICQVAVTALVESCLYRSAAIYLLHDSAPRLMALAGMATAPPMFPRLALMVTQKGKPVTFPNHHVLAVPLPRRKEIFGVVLAAPGAQPPASVPRAKRSAGVRAADRALTALTTVANHLALILSGAMAYQVARDRATRLAAINEIGRMLSATTDLHLLYRIIHAQVKRVMDATVFYIALYNEQQNLLAFPYTADGDRIENVLDDLIEYPLGDGPTSWVVRERRPLIVTQPDNSIQNAGRSFGYVGQISQSAIHMPMLHGERMVGVISVQSYIPNAYSAEDIAVLEAIASQAAVAIENAQLIRRLQDAYVRQRELDRLKDEFILTASHELRTPLATIMGYLYLLKDFQGELDSTQADEFIAQALDSAEQLNMMVNNLMDASRLQGEHIQITLQPVALASLIQSLVANWRSIAGERIVDVMVPEGLIVLADAERLRQILGNLLSNAMKYTPADRPIQIRAEQNLPDPDHVTISVIDQGPGIAVGDQQRVFEKFVRLEETMKTSVRGTGLGLYICRQLVNAMGGDIWVESEAGSGAAFRFTLRVASGNQPIAVI
jgi:K+-sensing histidine kinase KdpD